MALKARKNTFNGFSVTELILSSVIFATLVITCANLWNSTTRGMNRSSLRNKVDSAIALRMEEIRHCALFYKLDNSSKVDDTESDCRLMEIDRAETLSYSPGDTECENGEIGDGFEDYLEDNDPDLLDDFDLNDYDSNAESVAIEFDPEPDDEENRLIITLTSSPAGIPVTVQTSVTPAAHGWCS